jgi:hypothetical protein
LFPLNLHELLAQLQFITNELAVLALFVTAALIVLFHDWRITLLALLAQYLAAGFLLSRLVSPEIALIKVFVGALICTMLYLAARQGGYGSRGARRPMSHETEGPGFARSVFGRSISFRVLSLMMALLLAVVLNQSYPLPRLSPGVGLGTYWLLLVGLFVLIATERPLYAAPGLLTVVTAFELLYTPLERSLTIVWLWTATTLVLAVGISYLIMVRGGTKSEGGL